jgi:hypothetical protein
MDSAPSPLPSPSGPWSHIAVTHGEFATGAGKQAALAGPHGSPENATQLRARLLRMIVDSEHSRKSAAADSFHAR